MPFHIQASGSQIFAQRISRLEVYALQHSLLKVSRHSFARFVVAHIVVENLRNGSKRLIKLRWHFHKVASHSRSRQRVVFAVRQHAVQRMTKLMKQRAHLVPSQQRRLTLRRLGKVAHIIYNRLLSAISALLRKRTHPCATTLRRSAEVVVVE